MRVTFRTARRDEVPAILDLLTDDSLGATRETADLGAYLEAFDRMQTEGGNTLIVGVDEADRVVATYQMTLISGLSLAAARRAQVESVRVTSDLRGKRVGEAMFDDVEARARAADCALIQLTMNAERDDAKRFYERLGFTPSHIGFKRYLT